MLFTTIIFVCASMSAIHGYQDLKTLWLPAFKDSVHKPYNPSLVEYDGRYYSAVRFSRTPKIGGKEWYMDRVYICRSEFLNLHALRCHSYYPFEEPYNECEYPPEIRDGATDIWGLGDMKFFLWPSVGVFSLFGRKPPRKGHELYCNDRVVYVPWLAAVDTLPSSPWSLKRPIHLKITSGYRYPQMTQYVEEKNWMPWIYTSVDGHQHLHMTHMVNPHRVLEVSTNGNCRVAYETTNDRSVFSWLLDYDVHGGPPVVFVPANMSKSSHAYYMGILHYFSYVNATKGPVAYTNLKLYRHFAFKFSADPPFRIFSVSDEIYLPSSYHNHELPVMQTVAFISGFCLSKGDLYLSYGVGDLESRVLVMSLNEFDNLFSGSVKRLPRRYGDTVET